MFCLVFLCVVCVWYVCLFFVSIFLFSHTINTYYVNWFCWGVGVLGVDMFGLHHPRQTTGQSKLYQQTLVDCASGPVKAVPAMLKAHQRVLNHTCPSSSACCLLTDVTKPQQMIRCYVCKKMTSTLPLTNNITTRLCYSINSQAMEHHMQQCLAL